MMVPAGLYQLWVYLSASPLLWLTATVVVYVLGESLYLALGRHALANPVVFAILVLLAVLQITGVPYAQYFEGAQFVHFLLGPATVALAVPLYQQLAGLRRHWRAIMACVLVGGGVAAGSAMVVAAVLGAAQVTILSLGPKSVTTPIAMAVAHSIGGEPALTAVMVIITGIFGAMVARPVLNVCGVRDERARGLAMGVAAHGIGTAAAFDESRRTGAYSGMAMALSGVFTAILLPLALR